MKNSGLGIPNGSSTAPSGLVGNGFDYRGGGSGPDHFLPIRGYPSVGGCPAAGTGQAVVGLYHYRRRQIFLMLTGEKDTPKKIGAN